MISRRHRHRVSERELAALADGSLAPERRQSIERAIAASPEVQAALREQHRALGAVQAAADERAPAALRARVAAARPGARPARRIGALALAATAALATAVVVTLGGGGAQGPSVADAAVLATRPPLTPAREPAQGGATLLSPHRAGLGFPYWEEKFGWKTIGVRRDRLDGRPATTVFYRARSQVVAYTIVDGASLPVGSLARLSVHRGTALRAFAVHGRRVVTWLRRGHTCVLSGRRTAYASLFRLAAWRGGGDLAY